jgi:hypothetical protein
MELTNTEIAVILEALGNVKAYLNERGFRESAHEISKLQAKLKNEGKKN